jgi:hypothetical protein
MRCEVQVCLKHGKGEKSIKEEKQKKLKPRAKAVKTGGSDFGNRKFKCICFGNIFSYPCKRAMSCCL